jgi:outer membrane protein, multidrug efflux system
VGRLLLLTRATLAAISATLVAGCTVGPNYTRPAVETPTDWRIDYPKAAEVANTKWWEQFGDPVLDDLIETALRENRDVRIAAARVDQFVGALMSTRAQLSPQIGYAGDVSRVRTSREGFQELRPGVDNYFTLYEATLGASWQLDLFGRVRRLTEAAQAQVYASEQGRRGLVLTLTASVASSYVGLRALDRQLEIAQATAKNFGETSRIFAARFKAGMVSQTEVAQADSQLQQALAAIPALEQAIAAQENFISLLEGHASAPIPRGKTITALTPPPIPADLPATLLERRPDVLQAEQNLIAANAAIGAARALYFPAISLTGALGYLSVAASAFLTGAASTGLIAAGVTGPIFTSGAIEGQVLSAEAQQRQAMSFYQQTILAAFRETNDALVGSQKKVDEITRQSQRVQSLREFARLSRLKFEKGVSSYLDVLVAENELFAAELSAVTLLAERHAQLVNVYRAMGGGWVDIAASSAPQAKSLATGQAN